MTFRIRVGDWIEAVFDWLQATIPAVFTAMRDAFIAMDTAVRWLFTTLPDYVPLVDAHWVVLVVVSAAGFFARGWKFGVGTALGLAFIVSVNQWDNAMATLSLVIVSTFIAVVVAIPLGIWAARSEVVSAIVKPLMDLLQTLPAFVYLVPALALFRIGIGPGIIATVLFALPPGVRLTELGIRGVDKEVVEAGEAFGATPGRILRQIQIPLAMPSIMAGINQIIMLALSMVVIAGLVGAGGLGGAVTAAIERLDIGLGFEAGLSVVALAIILDRFSASYGQRRGLYARLRQRAKDRAAAREQALLDALEDTPVEQAAAG